MLSNALTLPHILVIAVVALVLFGKGKVSSLMGEVGKGISAFKKGISEADAEAQEAPAALEAAHKDSM
ncbi:twin-arginine translocase TatA/TatE family subunit [Rhodobacter sp. 24-YEA-8]|uniref:twin-arginine translocase TatA/TatE family subunit n=1 Tax=Rhodobacter sp. 24-YEA-8 TaxID=1884310 RepID=UPI000899E5B1|nr:twin-arginine translocase TatA/TatE family subunit [Rhodobacter sp. 24-YEA-8]SED50332.1 sec-independent protein translocase protein TatA [Rhodobacter sp. 24-YEA-8]